MTLWIALYLAIGWFLTPFFKHCWERHYREMHPDAMPYYTFFGISIDMFVWPISAVLCLIFLKYKDLIKAEKNKGSI